MSADNEKIQLALEKEEGSSSASTRTLNKTLAIIVALISFAFILFHLYTGQFGLLSALRQRSVHLGFVMVLVFLYFPARKKWRNSKLSLVVDIILAGAAVVAMWYVFDIYLDLNFKVGNYTTIDVIISVIAILLTLEATRRCAGWQLPLIAVAFLLYGLLGGYMPNLIRHKGFAFDQMGPFMYLTTEGIFGMPLGVSASILVIFIAFAAFLEQSGAGEFFIELANSLTGRTRGGPAKAAVVASGFFGTFSGSAVANVVGSGTFTIPLMKRIGYNPAFAAAVEAVGSSGGQLMPPVMGSAAFIMAEMLGISYLDVALAAAIPALLYYLALFIAIDFEARRVGLKSLDPELVPNFWRVMKKGWFLLIPPSLLVTLMLFFDFSAQKAGVWSIVSIVVVSYFSKEHRMGMKKLQKAFMGAAKGALMVGTATASMGIIIGVFGITGLGAKLSGLITGLAGGNLMVLLLLTMITSLILGMGVPTTAAYLILAVLVAPAMVKIGVLPIAAHLFVFYFGIISAITPPVAVASFAASAIAGTDSWRTSWIACRLGVTAFILPFMFVYAPELLGQGSPAIVAWTAFTAILGIVSLAAGVIGYFLIHLKLVERVIMLLTAIILIIPHIELSAMGLVMLTAVVIYQIYIKKNVKRNAAM